MSNNARYKTAKDVFNNMLLRIVLSNHDKNKIGYVTNKLSNEDRQLLMKFKASNIQDRITS